MAVAELEPVRWGEMRRGVSLVAWAQLISLVSCVGVLGAPLLIIGARAIMRSAPTHAVRAGAELLLFGALVGPVLAIAGWGALAVDSGQVAIAVLVVAAIGVAAVEVLGLIRTMRGLASWAAADAIGEQWEQSARRLVAAVAGALLCALIATVFLAIAFVAMAAFVLWGMWLIGYPMWCTYRLFRQDLVVPSSLRTRADR